MFWWMRRRSIASSKGTDMMINPSTRRVTGRLTRREVAADS